MFPAGNEVYNRGPIMNLIDSPSFPSGHTTYGYMGSLLLAVLVPDRYQEMVVRAAEYGNDRIILGAHYAMDVLGGRTVATYDLAHLLANDPAYIGRPLKDFARATAMSAASGSRDHRGLPGGGRDGAGRYDEGARSGLRRYHCGLRATGHRPLQRAGDERSLLRHDPDLRAWRRASGDCGQSKKTWPCSRPRPDILLTVAFPKLSLEEANRILTETEGPGGGFLDDGSGFGVYSRLNLYAAAGRAAALSRAKP